MPFSSRDLKDWLADKYKAIAPEVTVDIGPGCGTYSDLMRPIHKGTWKAVEAWGPYIPKYNLWQKYEHVIVSDVRHVDLFSVHYGPELVIMGDVIEHMAKEEAAFVIKRMQGWADNILISIPIGDWPQGDVGGVWFETHQATWSHEEMLDALGDGVRDSATNGRISAFHWSLE